MGLVIMCRQAIPKHILCRRIAPVYYSVAVTDVAKQCFGSEAKVAEARALLLQSNTVLRHMFIEETRLIPMHRVGSKLKCDD